MPSGLVAGVDSSTQATKVLIVDCDEGTVVAEGRAAHTVTGEGGARETDPTVPWQGSKCGLFSRFPDHQKIILWATLPFSFAAIWKTIGAKERPIVAA